MRRMPFVKQGVRLKFPGDQGDRLQQDPGTDPDGGTCSSCLSTSSKSRSWKTEGELLNLFELMKNSKCAECSVEICSRFPCLKNVLRSKSREMVAGNKQPGWNCRNNAVGGRDSAI